MSQLAKVPLISFSIFWMPPFVVNEKGILASTARSHTHLPTADSHNLVAAPWHLFDCEIIWNSIRDRKLDQPPVLQQLVALQVRKQDGIWIVLHLLVRLPIEHQSSPCNAVSLTSTAQTNCSPGLGLVVIAKDTPQFDFTCNWSTRHPALNKSDPKVKIVSVFLMM